MLAQNFLTAAELGISEREQVVLVRLLGMLERGEIQELPKNWRGANIPFFIDPPPTLFFMSVVTAQTDCGTVACLLGWARYLDQEAFPRGVLIPLRIKALFLPAGEAISCRDPALGAQALRNFLTTGEARWEEVMKAAAAQMLTTPDEWREP